MKTEEDNLCFVFRILFSVFKKGDIACRREKEIKAAATQVFCVRERDLQRTYGERKKGGGYLGFYWVGPLILWRTCVFLYYYFLLLNLLDVFLEGHLVFFIINDSNDSLPI